MALEAELALAGPEHRLDPLAHRSKPAEATRLVLSVGAQKARAIATPIMDEVKKRVGFIS